MTHLAGLPFFLLLIFYCSTSISQDCEGVFDSQYFELVPFNEQGVQGGLVTEGSNLNIEVRSIDFNLLSFQYTIAYDTTKLSFVEIDGTNSVLNGYVSFYESLKGKIGVVWTQDQGSIDILQNGSVLFNIHFTSLVSNDECLALTMTNTPIYFELATEDSMNNICTTLEPNNFLFNPPLCEYINPNDMDFDGFTLDEDCDDINPNINPDALDNCDGIDNNCNGVIDEQANFNPYYADNDGDGFGNLEIDTLLCEFILGWVLNSDDCDDTNENINPEAQECSDDGIDNDCDGEVDEPSFNFYFLDADGDGFGVNTEVIESCFPVEGYVLGGFVDCNDNDASINPDAEDICDGIDNNCDGEIDNGQFVLSYYQDLDGDGYGDFSIEEISCEMIEGFVTNAEDCDDTNAAINPEAVEVPGNNIDENCDGMDGVVSATEELNVIVHVYPNPITDFVQIKLDDLSQYDFKMYNQQGLLVRTQKISTNVSQVNVEDLNPGLYIFILLDERAVINTGKLVKF